MLVKLQCPQCRAQMEIDDQQEHIFCSFCGTKIANLREKVEITQNVNVSGTVRHVMDRSNEPNLYISYATANSSVVMVVRIVDTGTKNTYFNGQTQTYHLSPGRHDIVLKIGRKNYDRTVFIPADNAPDLEDVDEIVKEHVEFVLVDSLLRDVGIHAPKILASDLTNGFLLLEDFGNLRQFLI